jgi:CheY-like chemotaxis protein
MNLVNNAIKFTHHGHVELSAELLDKSGDSIRLLFRIKDTGIGISDDGKLLLFKDYSQSESNISRKYGGTGLGLSISKNLVNLMDGDIGVESTLNKGSEFWFNLPLKAAKINEIETLSQVESVPQNLKILLAEDNIINQKVAELTLKQFGLKCDVANDGMEAFNLFIKNNYELVLMDMQMPEVDGLQATEMIRTHENGNLRGSPAYIVALTANAMAEDKKQCLLAGMNNFLSKPFTEKGLSQILVDAGKRLRKQ